METRFDRRIRDSGTMETRFDRRIRDSILDFIRPVMPVFGSILIFMMHELWWGFLDFPDSRKSDRYIYIVNSRPFTVLRTLSHLNSTLIRILKSSKMWVIQILNLVTRNNFLRKIFVPIWQLFLGFDVLLSSGNFNDQQMTEILIQCTVRYCDLSLLREIFIDISMADSDA
jgi:hypothetical protein